MRSDFLELPYFIDCQHPTTVYCPYFTDVKIREKMYVPVSV